MRHLLPAGLVIAALLTAPGARADDAEMAEAYFTSGEYDLAVSEAATQGDADACAFSARALLAKAMSGEGDPPEALLYNALDEADAALALDSAHIEGRLQRAIALSLIIRPMSVREARRTGWGEEARDLAEAVLEDDPDNTYAHGFLAVWHIEIVRRGGPIGAMVLGASLDDARAHYAVAIAQAPHDASVHWQYARALAALNARKHRDEINAALDAAAASPVDSVLEGVMQARAAVLQAEMTMKDYRQAEKLAVEML